MNTDTRRTVSFGRIARFTALIALAGAITSCALVGSLVGEPESDPPRESRDEPQPPESGPDSPDPDSEPEPSPGVERDDAERPQAIDPGGSDEEPDDPADAATSAPTTDWRALASGDRSAVRVPVARAVGEPGLWRDVWAALTANRLDPPEPPEVDFSRETVVVLILGERPTGGYEVGIADLIVRGEEVLVVVDVVRPDPDAVVTQALTTPYYIAAVPVTDRAFVFTGDSVEAGFHGD